MNFSKLSIGLALFILGACDGGNTNSTVSSTGGQPCQASAGLTSFAAEAQYVFPEGLAEYKAGTLVFQPKTGQVFRCKGYPYSGFCQQWSESATMFEPGTGSNWIAAWDLQ